MCGDSFINPMKIKNSPSRIDRLLRTIEPIRCEFWRLLGVVVGAVAVVMTAACEWWMCFHTKFH